MNFKSYLIEKNYSQIEKTRSILFYGENIGLKNFFKKLIKNNNKQTKIVSFLQDEILHNANLLFNELSNLSLFEEKKIIFIENTNDKILKVIENTLEGVLNYKLFIFAEILDKKSKLRSFYEKSNVYGAVPCYADNTITIQRIIQEQLKNYQGLSNFNLNIILEACGDDRDKIYNELDKITLFFENKKIETEDLLKLLNSPRIDDFNYLKDEVIKGNKNETNKLLNSTVIDQDRSVYYLSLINQRFYKLMDILRVKKGNNYEDAVNNLKPPIFWKDKKNIIDQAKLWNSKKIQIILKKIFDLEIIFKSNANINKDILIKKLLIDVCYLANSS
tara:strand:+ start:1791 stop:2786 length:996 start_codon:yes stop_codon:yes gene_type:complete